MNYRCSIVGFFLLAFFYLKIATVSCQIKGTVIDINTERPLIGATILSLIDSTVSNNNGEFLIQPGNDSTIIINYLGYQSQRISVKGKIDIQCKLEKLNTEIPEINIITQYARHTLGQLPRNLSVLNEQDINQNPGFRISNKLNLLPGVYMQSGTINTNRLTVRGIGSRTPYSTNRIKVFLNQIPLTSLEGVSAIEDIETDFLSDIKLIKGPKSALYGAGLGGTIIAHSKKTPRYGLNGTVGIEVASHNTLGAGFNLNINKAKNNFSLFFKKTDSDGYRENNSVEKSSMLFTHKFIGAKINISSTLLTINNEAEIPSSINDTTFKLHPNKAAANWKSVRGREDYIKTYFGSSINYKFNSKLSTQTTLYLKGASEDEFRPFGNLTSLITQVGVKQGVIYDLTRLRFNGSIEFQNENFWWSNYDVTDSVNLIANQYLINRKQLSFILFGQYSLNKFIFEGGINLTSQNFRYTDNVDDTIDYSGNRQFNPMLSPMFGVSYQAKNKISVFSSVSHGFSFPSSEESMISTGYLNPNLQPEQGYTIDVGSRIKLNSEIYFEAGYYIIFLNNLLVTKRESEVFFYGINAGKTRHNGIELEANGKFLLSEKLQQHLVNTRFNFTISQNKFIDFIDQGINYRDNYLPGIPEYTFNGSVTFTAIKNLNILLHYQNIGKQFMTDDNSQLYPGYDIVNAHLSYILNFKKEKSLQLNFSVKNIFNEHYASMILVNASNQRGAPRYYYPGLPRNFYTAIKFNF